MQPVFQYSLAGFDINFNGTARIAATHQAPAFSSSIGQPRILMTGPSFRPIQNKFPFAFYFCRFMV
jgi:hypothetical protein